jgi:hypothetical protein
MIAIKKRVNDREHIYEEATPPYDDRGWLAPFVTIITDHRAPVDASVFGAEE